MNGHDNDNITALIPRANAGRWPAGHRSALIVSIDVDGTYGEANHHGADDFYWRSQTEYDLQAGVWRLLDLLADREIPFIFATGYGDSEHPPRHKQIKTLTKPYSIEQVRAALPKAADGN